MGKLLRRAHRVIKSLRSLSLLVCLDLLNHLFQRLELLRRQQLKFLREEQDVPKGSVEVRKNPELLRARPVMMEDVGKDAKEAPRGLDE